MSDRMCRVIGHSWEWRGDVNYRCRRCGGRMMGGMFDDGKSECYVPPPRWVAVTPLGPRAVGR